MVVPNRFYQNTLLWDKRFLQLAKLVSTWSKDPSTQVGCVIVDQNKRVISTGYNGFPQKLEDSKELYENREKKYERVLHAEQNAMMFAKRDLTDCTLYTYPLIPCSKCALEIIQNGIANVVSVYPTSDALSRWQSSFDLTKDLFSECGLTLTLYDLKDGL